MSLNDFYRACADGETQTVLEQMHLFTCASLRRGVLTAALYTQTETVEAMINKSGIASTLLQDIAHHACLTGDGIWLNRLISGMETIPKIKINISGKLFVTLEELVTTAPIMGDLELPVGFHPTSPWTPRS